MTLNFVFHCQSHMFPFRNIYLIVECVKFKGCPNTFFYYRSAVCLKLQGCNFVSSCTCSRPWHCQAGRTFTERPELTPEENISKNNSWIRRFATSGMHTDDTRTVLNPQRLKQWKCVISECLLSLCGIKVWTHFAFSLHRTPFSALQMLWHHRTVGRCRGLITYRQLLLWVNIKLSIVYPVSSACITILVFFFYPPQEELLIAAIPPLNSTCRVKS